MAALYPGALDTFTPKTDGPAQKIMAAHVNDLQNAVVAVETELGTDPAGSLTNLKTRLAVMLTAAGGLIGPERIRTVAKSGASYTTITAAIASISDAVANKIYTILVFPGEYNEGVTLKNYVDIIAVNPLSTKILQRVKDDEEECHCYLYITVKSANGIGLYIVNSNSVINFDGDISSSDGAGVLCEGGLISISGDISSSTSYPVDATNGTVIVNGNISSSFNNASGHGVYIGNGSFIMQNGKIVCTHADAKSIYAASAKNVRCMSVWANRDDDVNITQLITGGFTFNADVQ